MRGSGMSAEYPDNNGVWRAKRLRSWRLALLILSLLLLGSLSIGEPGIAPLAPPTGIVGYLMYVVQLTAYGATRIFGAMVYIVPFVVAVISIAVGRMHKPFISSSLHIVSALFLSGLIVQAIVFPADHSHYAGLIGRVVLTGLGPVGGRITLLPVLGLVGYCLVAGVLNLLSQRTQLRPNNGRSADGALDKPHKRRQSLELKPLRWERRLSVNRGEPSNQRETHEDLAPILEQAQDAINDHGLPLVYRDHTGAFGSVLLRYDLEAGTSLRHLRQKQADLEYRLASLHPMIRAPMPGESSVGILLSYASAKELTLEGGLAQFVANGMTLPVYTGYSSLGKHTGFDLSRQPHMLVGGTTGTGKTSFIRAMILSLLSGPAAHRTRFVLIDPKRVEMVPFRRLPHLAQPVVTDMAVAGGVIETIETEMERRYEVFERGEVSGIDEYNHTRRRKMTYLVVVVDEAADLLMQTNDQTADRLLRLAQKARTVGIHLIIGTQRPSADVIRGVFKANLPARVAFRTATAVDSRVILDTNGAERLRGSGDALVRCTETHEPERVQAPWISPERTSDLVKNIRYRSQ